MHSLSSASSNSTSTGLLARVKSHEADAWRRLVELYSPLVYHWCRTSGLQPNDAADILQEVFSAVTARIADFRHDRPGDTFRGWLRTITRYKVVDFRRRQQHEPPAAGGTDALQNLQEIANPSDAGESDVNVADTPQPFETNLLFQKGLELIRSEFEPRSWQAFWRVAVEGQRADAVAQDLGISVNAVYVAKSRVLRRFRQELDDPLA